MDLTTAKLIQDLLGDRPPLISTLSPAN